MKKATILILIFLFTGEVFAQHLKEKGINNSYCQTINKFIVEGLSGAFVTYKDRQIHADSLSKTYISKEVLKGAKGTFIKETGKTTSLLVLLAFDQKLFPKPNGPLRKFYEDNRASLAFCLNDNWKEIESKAYDLSAEFLHINPAKNNKRNLRVLLYITTEKVKKDGKELENYIAYLEFISTPW